MRAFGMTDTGRTRMNNQDSFYVCEHAVGKLPNLYIVADGMGGHRAGEVASKTAVESMVECIEGCHNSDPVMVLQQAVTYANEEVLALAKENPEFEGMGTTMIAATILNDVFYVANVGDSRLYVVNDQIHQITRDHSYVEEMVSRGQLDKEEARTHYRKNVITRAIGMESGINADYFRVTYHKGDKILICSDGLSNMIRDEDLKNLTKRNYSPEDIVQKLIFTANENGGLDNITAILIELDER